MGSGYLRTPRGTVDQRAVTVNVGGGEEEILENLVEGPTGKVKTELFDERTGRKVQEEVGDNFISRLWVYTARSWQRLAWAKWPIVNNPSLEYWPVQAAGRAPWAFPNETIVCWNDSTSEAPSTEHMIKTDGQGIVAHAGRNPSGSPSGKRGVVNVTDSYWDETGETQVYDWPTTSGNGVFRSVGYGGVNVGNEGILHLRSSYVDRRYYTYAGSLKNYVYGGTPSENMEYGAGGFDAAGDYIIPVGLRGLSNKGAFLKLSASELSASLSRDGFGAVEKVIASPTVLFNNSPHKSNATTSNRGTFFGEYGGYYWYGGHIPTTLHGLCRVHKTTGAVDRQVANPNFSDTGTSSGNYTGRGCIIGSNLYATAGANNPFIYRYDLTANPPTLTATINPVYPTRYASAQVNGMTTDGTDLYLHHAIGGVLKFNTSGTLLAELGRISTTAYTTEVGTSPFTGTQGRHAGGIMEAIALSRNTTEGNEPELSNLQGNALFGGVYPMAGSSTELSWYSSGLWSFSNALHQTSPIYSSMLTTACEVGWNLGSRVLLASDVTKTSSNTMKVTYEITLPDIV